MGQEVVNGDWPIDSLALVPVASSSTDGSGGLMGGRSDGLPVKSSFSDEDIYSTLPARRGLAGLQNLGNTCFMNSALQCLAHTPELVEYFLQDYSKEINRSNPLGMEGELAEAFGELIRSLWTSGKASVAPRSFKTKLSHFAPQFGGYNQHDSQELLAFLMDGLHEDLNRVKSKPYSEAKDADGRPDAEVAKEYWANHKARNDSIIVDVFHGQYKSTLVCPVCNKISVTFDPFMYLGLPLPAQYPPVTMTFTVFGSDAAHNTVSIEAVKSGPAKALLSLLENACNLQENETIRLVEVHDSYVLKTFHDAEKLDGVVGTDKLVVYKMQNMTENTPVLHLYHAFSDSSFAYYNKPKLIGCPLLTTLPEEGLTDGAELYELVERTLGYLRKEDSMDEDICRLFSLYMTDERGTKEGTKIEPDEPLPPGFASSNGSRDRFLLLLWTNNGLEQYAIQDIHLPGVSLARARPRPDPVSLYTCLDTFAREEPLGPDDMWYCPCCKTHRQASKKLDLWLLPEILVVHLKRFSFRNMIKTKLETFVDFPVHDLDMSGYIPGGTTELYELFAVSNHIGGMGGGHYTAYAKLCDENKWYTFDDSSVSPMSEDNVRTSAAYVLFYRRKREVRRANGHVPASSPNGSW